MAKSTSSEVPIPNPPSNGSTTGLVQDEVIARLVPDPAAPPDVIALKGFLGKSPRPKFWRLYQTLDLKTYVEIAEGDIVHSEPLETKLRPLGGTIIWVKSGARLHHTRNESQLAEARFMQGDITREFLEGDIVGLFLAEALRGDNDMVMREARTHKVLTFGCCPDKPHC